jgi:predicted outer membrane repeat protein
VAGGNTVGTGGEGGGIYAGGAGCTGVCPADVTLNDATVAGNSSGGTGSAIAGDDTDTLRLNNDIVTPNTGTGDSLDGFGTLTVAYTDGCDAAGVKYPGTGNTCANPLLVSLTAGAIDVHQTAASPTRNAGLDSLVIAGVTEDYEGDARVQEAAVDMGADEFTPLAPGLPAAGAPPADATPAWQLFALLAIAAAITLEIARRWPIQPLAHPGRR